MRLSLIALVLCLFFPASAMSLSLPQLAQSAQETDSVDELRERWSHDNGQQVTLRGFLYQTGAGGWILSSRPNLKTCCVGNPVNAMTQVAVQGVTLTPSPDSVVTLQGLFHIEPVRDSDGTLTALFHLHNAELVPEASATHLPLTLLLGCVVAAGAFFLSFRLMKK